MKLQQFVLSASTVLASGSVVANGDDPTVGPPSKTGAIGPE